MMEKRQKELIVFVVAVVALGLLVVMTLGKGKRPRPQATADTPEVQVAAGTSTSGPEATGDQEFDVEDKGPMLPIQGNTAGRPRERDPFVPTINVGFVARATQTDSTTRNGPVPPVPSTVVPPPPVSLPWITGPPTSIRPADPNAGATVTTTVQQQEPIRLTGIIQGDPPVAIFRRAEKRFIVKPGDEFAGYRVIEIAAHRVALVRGSKHHSLFLGGKL